MEEELKTNSGTGNIIKICKSRSSSCPAGDIAENGCNFHLDEMQSGESKTFYDTTLPKTGSVDAYCEQNGSFTLTNNSCSCQPQCSGAACGADDGCAGTCQAGTCSGGNTCVAGTCACMVSEFLRFCDGPTGPSTGRVFDDALCQCVCPSGTQWNGVGCGTCGDGMVQPGEECDGWTGCVQCKCVDPYIPVDGSNDGECVLRSNCSCEGKSCGSDGCGRSCGSCLVGQTCNASWQCEAARTYHWEIKSVGSKPIGGQGCTAGETYSINLRKSLLRSIWQTDCSKNVCLRIK